MPQSSPIYGVTRVRFHEKDLIKEDTMKRLAEAPIEELMRVLQDVGYGSLPDARPEDVDTMITRELGAAYGLIREVTFEPEQTELMLMKADLHNLKLLLKLRLVGGGAEAFMQGGNYPIDTLKRMVQNGEYRDLPEEFKTALNVLEQSFQANVDPAKLSVELDKAYIAYGMRRGKGLVKEYFTAMADFTNILTMLRMRKMGAGAEKLKSALLPAGDIPHSRILAALEATADGMGKLIATGAKREAILRGLEAYQKTGALAPLERERDSFIMLRAREGRLKEGDIAPVIGYLLAREQEGKALRLIVTAKRNKLPDGVIAERLGNLYG